MNYKMEPGAASALYRRPVPTHKMKSKSQITTYVEIHPHTNITKRVLNTVRKFMLQYTSHITYLA